MLIVIGSDHAGYHLKQDVAPYLKELGHDVVDIGSFDPDPVDFPDIAKAVCDKVRSGEATRGLLVCGTGVGAVIYTAKVYEVQKYCSLTNHMWDGFWFLANKQSFERLPADLQTIVRNAVNDAAVKERADVIALDNSIRGKLEATGLKFNEVDKTAFRKTLQASGFYADWQKKFGPQAWAILEKYSGKLG